LIRNYLITLGILILLPSYSNASEECPICTGIHEHLHAIFPNTVVQSVKPSPMIGMYEVVMGNNIMYTDQAANLFLIGHIFNPRTNMDLTSQRLADIKRISFTNLPLKDAIASGDKNAKKLAVFTDPECPYCKKLEHMLRHLHGIRVYSFLMPLVQLHPDSKRKAQNIWCAKNQHQALINTMVNNQIMPDINCNNPIDRNIKLAESLGIMGTPTLISESGKVMNGMPRSEQALLEWLK